MNKTIISILKVLEGSRHEVIGSREISRQLKLHGIDLTERTIRYHLKIMDERGITQVFGKEGRRITEKGIEELKNSQVSDRVGFIISKIEALSYQTNFDLRTMSGPVILNVSLIPVAQAAESLEILGRAFTSPYVMSNRVHFALEGEGIGDLIVPEGMVGMGTVCSVTINGIFLKNGIPVTSKYGGVVEVAPEAGPTRFTALISYEGSSLDPLLVFIKSGMTSVQDALNGKLGKILASFREIPVVCYSQANEIRTRLKEAGIGGLLAIGNPNQPLLEVPVGLDRAGLVVVGGLNPVAALEESGIHTQSMAMSALMDYKDLKPFAQAAELLMPSVR